MFKRLIAAVLAVAAAVCAVALPQTGELTGGLAAYSVSAAGSYSSLKDIYIVFDGTRYSTKGYANNSSGEVYVSTDMLKTLFGAVPKQTVKSGKVSFGELKKMCEEQGMASYEYDKVLNAVYIWSKTFKTNCGDIDLSRAKYYGFGSVSDKSIKYSDFIAIMDKMISKAAPKKLSKWKNLTELKKARNSSKTITRYDAGLILLRAAAFLGGDYSEFNTDFGPLSALYGNKSDTEIGIASRTSLIDNADKPYNWGGFANQSWLYEQKLSASQLLSGFTLGKISLYSRNTLLDFDMDNNTLHLDRPITKKEAVLAAVRLLDSQSSAEKTFWLKSKDSRICKYDSSIITREMLAFAGDMPDVSDKNPPKWNGVTWGESLDDPQMHPEDFEEMAPLWSQWGFNAVRYTLPYQLLFSADGSKANESAFVALDRVVAAAAKNKLHLNLAFEGIPGLYQDLTGNQFEQSGGYDLFKNSKKQKQAELVCGVTAERYADIPSSLLSFYPLVEIAPGFPAEELTTYSEKIADTYIGIVNAIQKSNPKRYVIIEDNYNNPYSYVPPDKNGVTPNIDKVVKKCNNVTFTYNFFESAFVYYHMTATEGEQIDNTQRGMFEAYYPCTIYETAPEITSDKPLVLQAEAGMNSLPKGTKIDFNIWRVWGGDAKDGKIGFRIKGDGAVLYEEKLSHTGNEKEYKVTPALSGMCPYRDSEKCISVVLKKDYKEVTLEIDNIAWSNIQWSGLKVTLPDKYAVKRWYEPSVYEYYLENGVMPDDYSQFDPYLKRTSEILITPNGSIGGKSPNKITVKKNVSYSTSKILAQSNKSTVNAWGKDLRNNFSGNVVMRFESASFSGEYFSSIKYYDDILNMCEKNGFSWFTNDFGMNNYVYVSENHEFALTGIYPNSKNVKYKNGWIRKEMLEMFQSHLQVETVKVTGANKKFKG